jgi:hypothetical protein
VKTIEEYAIDLVCDGAESTAEDDLNEDEDIADADHRAACDLAVDIAHAIREHPDVVLELALKTPEEWQALIPGVVILDPDGWRGWGGRPWTDRISRREYLERRDRCTVEHRDWETPAGMPDPSEVDR